MSKSKKERRLGQNRRNSLAFRAREREKRETARRQKGQMGTQMGPFVYGGRPEEEAEQALIAPCDVTWTWDSYDGNTIVDETRFRGIKTPPGEEPDVRAGEPMIYRGLNPKVQAEADKKRKMQRKYNRFLDYSNLMWPQGIPSPDRDEYIREYRIWCAWFDDHAADETTPPVKVDEEKWERALQMNLRAGVSKRRSWGQVRDGD